MITINQWVQLGLDPSQHVVFSMTPALVTRQTHALRSVVREEGWIVVVPDWNNWQVDIVLGTGLKGQRARDTASFLASPTAALWAVLAGDPPAKGC